jgi:hypothetical protein
MLTRFLSLVPCFVVAALAGCAADAADSPTDASSTSADLSSVNVTPAHFRCSAPASIDFDVLTTKTEVRVTAIPGDNDAIGRLHADGHADLGNFLSMDHGAYSIRLDAKMLRGEAGHAVLTDDEPGDPPDVETYSCKLTSNDDGTPKMCGTGALADGHLQPGKAGGPDSRDVVKCEAGYTLCQIDPDGSDNDVCGDADDCFACSR